MCIGNSQPAGAKTVFLSLKRRLYLLKACMPARGSDAACSEESDFGLRQMYHSQHLAYSLQEPIRIERELYLIGCLDAASHSPRYISGSRTDTSSSTLKRLTSFHRRTQRQRKRSRFREGTYTRIWRQLDHCPKSHRTQKGVLTSYQEPASARHRPSSHL